MQPQKPNHQQNNSHEPPAEFGELVIGLRWDAMQSRYGATTMAVDLDIACLLLDRDSHIIEVIHPGNPRYANDSIIHTGDSTTGAGEWDDERIFVFPAAVPQFVAALTFAAASISGRPFADIPGSICHVSDHATEREWIRCELAQLGATSACAIATLYRAAGAWRICRGTREASVGEWIARELLPLLVGAKQGTAKRTR